MKSYTKKILRPLTANLDIPEFWELLAGIESMVISKRNISSYFSIEDTQTQSRAMDDMLSAIRAEKYTFISDDKFQLQNLFKWLWRIADNSVVNTLMDFTFYDVKKSYMKKTLQVSLQDSSKEKVEGVEEAAIERLKGECEKAGIVYEDTDTAEDINRKIRNLPLKSHYYKGRARKYNTKDAILEVIGEMGDDGWKNSNRKELIERVTVLATANNCKCGDKTIGITISQMKKDIGKMEVGQGQNMKKIALKHYHKKMTYYEFCVLLAPHTDSPGTVREYYYMCKGKDKNEN